MKLHSILTATVLTSALALGGNASASVQYFFSGTACQPQDSANAAKLQVVGAGISNKDTTANSSATATCPVTGLEATTLTQVELKVHGHGFLTSGYWELDNQSFGVIWYGAAKSHATTGDYNITWSGTDLYGSGGSSFSSYATYSFIPTLPGPCNSDNCNNGQSWIQAYWVTHDVH